MGLFENVYRPAKNDPAVRARTLTSSPPPCSQVSQRKTINTVTHIKRPPHQISPLPVRCPRDRSHGQVPMVHQRIQWSGPFQRIHTQNQQSTARWHPQEHTSQSLLPSHGNNDRFTDSTRMWLTSSENPTPTTKGQIQQNDQVQAFPHKVHPRRVPRVMGQDYPVTGPSATDSRIHYLFPP